MVICYTTKENINHYTTDFDNIDRFTEEHPYATIWYAFNEKDDVSSSNVEREKCPICGNAILKGQNNYYCSQYKNGCQFSLPFLICGKKLTATQLIMLLRQHRTKTISGFKSRTGKPFSAVLRYDTKTAKLHFEFPNAK